MRQTYHFQMIPVTRALIFILIWNLGFCKASINLVSFIFHSLFFHSFFFFPSLLEHTLKYQRRETLPFLLEASDYLFPSFHMTMNNVILFLFFQANESLTFFFNIPHKKSVPNFTTPYSPLSICSLWNCFKKHDTLLLS